MNLADVDDLAKRYEPMIRQVADLFPEDESLFAFLLGLEVNREEWDAVQGYGFFFFQETEEYACVELIELIADDADGATIEIALHLVGSRTSWGGLHRSDRGPVLRWPPPSVLPKSRHSKHVRNIESENAEGTSGERRRFHSVVVSWQIPKGAEEIAARYAPMIAQIAQMYAADPYIYTQLRSLSVTREEWDANRRGGHFWFSVSGPPAKREDFLVDARAHDTDGAIIDIILHPVNGILNWGEWYRVPLSLDDLEQPIRGWPPRLVDPNPA